jgi:hypothetical protein
MGLFGGPDDSNIFPSPVDAGKKLYFTVDSETGKQVLFERRGGLPANTIGSFTPPDNKFVPGPDIGNVFNEAQRRELLSATNLKKLRDEAARTAQNGCEGASTSNTPAGCRQRTTELLSTGRATTAANADVTTITNQTLNNIDIKQRAGTRKSFGNYRYPLDLNPQQDVIKFAMLEYKTKELQPSGTFGFGDRARVGASDTGGRILGTVILPIQTGIKDQNAVTWGEDRLNALQAATASVSLGALGDKAQENALSNISSAISQNAPEVKSAIQKIFAGQAAGVQSLVKRTLGAVVNPNLELLFDAPTLRPFSFSFKMSGRSKKEAEEIVKIIRFFKQGMAPIRSQSNLFLLAPNTFQVFYLRRGETKDHPFIGKMKECALISLSTDYTPENNYATLPDGEMVSYTITMEFKELEPVFNDDYEENGSDVTNLPAEIGF